MSFGKRLKESRLKRKLTQADVAKILGIDDTTISKYENDKSEPDNETLKRLSTLYQVGVGYLMEEKKDSAEKLIDYLEMELTDEEIIERMTFKVDDLTLTSDEVREFIAFVRAKRFIMKG